MKTLNCFLLLCTAATVLAGCSDTNKATAPAPAAAPQPKSAVTATTPGKAPEEPGPIYAYTPAGRRDPFTPIIVKEEKKSVLGIKNPLERWQVSEFKLSGIVWGRLGNHAMLEGPDGKGYFVKAGTVIGPNQGVIKAVTENSVVIEEKFKDPLGEINRKEIVIELRKKQEGMP